MDEITACYCSRMRLFRDRPDVLTPGRWHWCAPGARPVPWPHAYGSQLNRPDGLRDTDPPIGEVTGRMGRVRGEASPRYLGQDVCGTVETWQQGAYYSQRGTPAVDDEGVPVCCRSGPHDIGGQDVSVEGGWSPAGGTELESGGALTVPASYPAGGTELETGGVDVDALAGGTELETGGVDQDVDAGGTELETGGVDQDVDAGGTELESGGIHPTFYLRQDLPAFAHPVPPVGFLGGWVPIGQVPVGVASLSIMQGAGALSVPSGRLFLGASPLLATGVLQYLSDPLGAGALERGFSVVTLGFERTLANTLGVAPAIGIELVDGSTGLPRGPILIVSPMSMAGLLFGGVRGYRGTFVCPALTVVAGDYLCVEAGWWKAASALGGRIDVNIYDAGTLPIVSNGGPNADPQAALAVRL